MEAMADISNLLTEFNAKKLTIANAIDKSALEKNINRLEIAWNSGNAADAIKQATNFQKLAKKYKAKFSNTFWQTLESIASGDSVPQKMDSSTRPSSKYSRRESETAAASRGSTTEQPVKNKSQNEKESEQERAMDVQGIKYKAHQRQSDKSMVQKLQIIRNHIEDLAAAMRPRPNDVKNSNYKSEECNSLVEIILNQSAEVLNAYRQEKDRCNRTHVERATIRQVLKPICDAFIKTNTENMETIHMIEELGKCLNSKYFSEHDRIHQDSVKSKEELENVHKRISDTEKRLKDMFRHVTGQNYKESSNKDGKIKQENHPDPVELLQQTIYDLEKQLVDYTRMTDTKERLWEMFQHVTGREYKGPSILDGKGKEKNQYDTVEVLCQMISDMDKQLVDFTSQQVRIHKDSVKSKQELEHLKKRLSDTEKRLKEMFQHVTGREYNGPSNGKGMIENETDPVEVLQQLIYSMDKLFVDYTSDGMVSGRKANSDDRQQSAGMVPGRKALIDQTHQREIEGHIQLDLIRQRVKPICAEVLNEDMDGMDTIQMIECLGTFLKKQNVRTKLDTSQDSEQRQFQLERAAWLKRINDTEDKLKEMVEQVTQLKKAAVGSKFK